MSLVGGVDEAGPASWVGAMTENLAYYSRRGYAETHRAEQDGFRRVFFRKHIA